MRLRVQDDDAVGLCPFVVARMLGECAPEGDESAIVNVPVTRELTATVQCHVQAAALLCTAILGNEYPAGAGHAVGRRIGNEIGLIEFGQPAVQRSCGPVDSDRRRSIAAGCLRRRSRNR